MAEIVVRLRPDGTVEAVTHGLKGDACLDYIPVVEEVAGARTVESQYTDEFFEPGQGTVLPLPPDQIELRRP